VKLRTIWDSAIQDSIRLEKLFLGLQAQNERSIRSEFRNRIFDSKIVTWNRSEGLWRARGKDVLILGKLNGNLSHIDFSSENTQILLKSSLVAAMAAVDKILHEALIKHFATLAKSGNLDSMIDFPLSSSYSIALQSRERSGKGGKKRKRPGHLFKEEIVDILFEKTFLSQAKLTQVCSMCNLKKVFTEFSRKHAAFGAPLDIQSAWNAAYRRRNHIAHECDLKRKEKTRKVTQNRFHAPSYRKELEFIRAFGEFLSDNLH